MRLLESLLHRYKPTVVVFAGAHGKSMAISALRHILKQQGAEVCVVERAKTVDDALVKQGNRRWRLQLLLQLLGVRAYPKIFLIEAVSVETIPEQIHPLVVLTGQVDSAHMDTLIKRGLRVIANVDAAPKQEEELAARLTTYGIDHAADYQAEFIELIADEEAKLTGSTDPRWRGMQAKVKHKGSVLPLRLAGGLGRPHIYAALAAVAASESLGHHVLDALKQMREWTPMPARMTLVPGIKKSLLIDDSYQIDPVSALVCFYEASLIPLEKGKRRIAVVGDMDQLGADSAQQHVALGKALVDMGYDMIVGVGERVSDLLNGAEQAGLQRSHLPHFSQAQQTGTFVQDELKRGEVVVIKGGERQRLEAVVKELMAFPLRAKTDLIQR